MISAAMVLAPTSSTVSTLLSCKCEADDNEYLVELNVPTDYGALSAFRAHFQGSSILDQQNKQGSS